VATFSYRAFVRSLLMASGKPFAFVALAPMSLARLFYSPDWINPGRGEI